MSKDRPSIIDWHCTQVLSGSPFSGLTQLMALDSILAVLVLPVTLGPQKR